MSGSHDDEPRGAELRKLILAALGVVYGDIGTSPLYSLKECFHGNHAVDVTPENVYGILSLIVWSLVIVVSIKYLAVVMRADNRGEGGILALMALVRPKGPPEPWSYGWLLVVMGLFGSALLYGDGVITPAISVLSAVEGLDQAGTDVFKPFIQPITIVILIVLFWIQSRGTATIGRLFGPVMVAWFLTLAGLGLWSFAKHPEIVFAASPHYAIEFFLRNKGAGFLALGNVFLVCTGGEALYADMGHFGKKPIRSAWYAFVLPALLCNYFGQGALMLAAPKTESPFFGLVPHVALIPMVVLSTMATVIASQAMISGAFSLTWQAVQLGYSPRVEIRHTSAEEIGQIYISPVNWALLIATIGLVLGFKSSTNLASAYGIAVVMTMVITTVLAFVVARTIWKWRLWTSALVFAPFLCVELAFFGANVFKIVDGGWFPLTAGLGVFTLMSTWYRGRTILATRLADQSTTFEVFQRILEEDPPIRVPGTAIFMTGDPVRLPPALTRNLAHNRVLHERVVLLSVLNEEIPHVAPEDRFEIHQMGRDFYRMIVHYGFMEEPNIPRVLDQARHKGFEIEEDETTFFLGHETLLPTDSPGMALWREKVFAFMLTNAQRATAFYRIPPGHVIEIGAQIEI